MTIELVERPDGVVLPVKAQAGASKAGIRGQHDGMLKVAVRQVAEKGKANHALVEALARSLELKESQIQLIGGELSHQKRFLVRGISRAELAQRIELSLAQVRK